VHIESNLVPWRFAPVRLRAASVLELPHHTLAQTETVLGDRIEINMGGCSTPPRVLGSHRTIDSHVGA
jgi:uncharacterized membrane protein (UPF0127 family)